MLSRFLNHTVMLGGIPFVVTDRRARLEYGRHHGVPTPVIDFSHSPYVALFFAFNGLRPTNTMDNAAVYALDLSALGLGWARRWSKTDPMAGSHYSDFLHERPLYFQNGYPADTLKWIPFCASWNKRMRNQLGGFLYDTVDYRMPGMGGSFEGLVQVIREPTGPDSDESTPTLIKFLIPHSELGKVLARLELMNMTGTKLLDHEGMASDVKNTYHYTPKSGVAWDLEIPPPNEAKS